MRRGGCQTFSGETAVLSRRALAWARLGRGRSWADWSLPVLLAPAVAESRAGGRVSASAKPETAGFDLLSAGPG